MKKIILLLLLITLFTSNFTSFLSATAIKDIAEKTQELRISSLNLEERPTQLNVNISVGLSKKDVVPGEVFYVNFFLQNNYDYTLKDTVFIDELYTQPIRCVNELVPASCDGIVSIFYFGDIAPGESKVVSQPYALTYQSQVGQSVTNGDFGGVLKVNTAEGLETTTIQWSVKSISPEISDIKFNKRGLYNSKTSLINFNVNNLYEPTTGNLYFQNSLGEKFLVRENIALENGQNLVETNKLVTVPSDTYKALIEITKNYHIDNSNQPYLYSKLSDEDIEIYDLRAEIISPNGGEKYMPGDTLTTFWKVTGNAKFKNRVVVMLFKTGPASTVLYEIHTGLALPGMNSIEFVLPTDIVIGDDYKVGITLLVGEGERMEAMSDHSNSYFTIGVMATPTPTPSPSPSPSPTPSPTPFPTFSPTGTPTPFPTPSPTPTQYIEPDFPLCPKVNCIRIGNYQDVVMKDSSAPAKQFREYEFTIQEDLEVYIDGYVKEGHPEMNCVLNPTQKLCNQKQTNEELTIGIDTAPIYQHFDTGADVNAWIKISGANMINLSKGTYKIRVSHDLTGKGAGSIDFKFSVFGRKAE